MSAEFEPRRFRGRALHSFGAARENAHSLHEYYISIFDNRLGQHAGKVRNRNLRQQT